MVQLIDFLSKVHKLSLLIRKRHFSQRLQNKGSVNWTIYCTHFLSRLTSCALKTNVFVFLLLAVNCFFFEHLQKNEVRIYITHKTHPLLLNIAYILLSHRSFQIRNIWKNYRPFTTIFKNASILGMINFLHYIIRRVSN